MRLDFFPKFIDSAMTHKTACGAFNSILMIACALALCISEIYAYAKPALHEQLVSVSDLRGALDQLSISFNFTVSVPCVLLHLDVFDMMGSGNRPDQKTLYKVRVDQNGNPIPQTQIAEDCGPCYGAESSQRKCCQTCEDVVAAYQEKGWGIGNLSSWAQCRAEGVMFDGKERCQAYGNLHVNAIEGGFHLAPGINVFSRFGHVHDFSPLVDTLNLTHEIEHISFGAPIDKSPLDNTRVVQKKPGQIHYRYNLKAVPTVKEVNGKVHRFFRFTVNYAEIPVTARGRYGPGIFFVYSFAPVAITSTYDRPNITVLLARLISIFGGSFMLARLIDSFTYRLNTIEGKDRINKFE
ncbi:hypothetical protein TVAG_100310 [Trichomonas vaginalis G3]|uniref:Endoplasmic reticulum vesicle transporter C-terminal domain-containing protein n=1 Tax=Trichomonas vaginalis (strain ATCC PRA-98 / G3) TaxID=412133 RepID=A2G7R1_TRIV3|nr:vesicle-mediated transport [Trichomonas vaginalis G3]EAX86809.1 hypothetical protein TVAG_100310 [Trichomonas vaginalis G3]KAI5516829.1 vesicle-mediated transport [Trichomonas vaginalis G3]|eukprot:XP_001299739.1 hypothetical protein [Trichomonas vaginalis G3]